MAQVQVVDLIKRVVVSILYILGTPLAAYHLTAFKNDKVGMYFKDGNQLWLAIGIGMVVVGWVIRNWKKF